MMRRTFKSRIWGSVMRIGSHGMVTGIDLTITERPLVYTILSLLELSFVASPRAVAGAHGCKMPFLKDIEIIDVNQGVGVMKTTPKGFRVGSLTSRMLRNCGIRRSPLSPASLIVAGVIVPDLAVGAVM